MFINLTTFSSSINGKGKMKTFQIQGKYQLLENRSGNDFC